MRPDISAYAALGLRPGASRAEVEEAYRRLIKRYHPDRAGGDAGRAAEINRAYSELRRLGTAIPHRAATVRPPQPVKRRRRSRRASWLAVGISAIAAAAILAGTGPERRSQRAAVVSTAQWQKSIERQRVDPARLADADLDAALEGDLIDRQVEHAILLHDPEDDEAALSFSRACQESLRDRPSLAWFDTCAAFDEAMMLLQAGDARSDAGQFGPRAVIGREIAATKLLSNDVLAGDSRVHRIRSRVELAILPRLDSAAAAAGNQSEEPEEAGAADAGDRPSGF